jgi:hypothetical protein
LGDCNNVLPGSFNAAADSWIDKTKPTVNYGSSTTLHIRPTGGIDMRTLIRFDLSSIPAGSQIHSAILYIYDELGNQTYDVDIYRVTSNWDEMSVTWNSAITMNMTAIGGFKLTSANCTRASYLDPVVVKGWVDQPAINYGVMLYPPNGAGDMTFSSRESTTQITPQLWVDYSMP